MYRVPTATTSGEAKAAATVEQKSHRLVDIVTAWFSWTTSIARPRPCLPQLHPKPELKQASNAWTSGLTKARPSAENLRHWSGSRIVDVASPPESPFGTTILSYGVCKRTQDGRVGGSTARQVDNLSSLIS
jgi:hypothetical protein